MMTTEAPATDTSVRKSIVVRTSLEHAFAVFTQRLDLWWPKTHHIGKAAIADAKMEPKEGGRWYEVGVDGSECDWGRVLVWSPPRKIALSWQITPAWTFEPDPQQASRIDVSFQDLGDGTTRVELVHSDLERHGKGWESLRDAVASDGGWPGILVRYRDSAEAS